ncbi:MAG TPA: hypothetical protein VG916_06180, partial [Gemmatimonadaceae bacterium]|nr:hypothetical protein [Gemmatimonadaceae bacterium]
NPDLFAKLTAGQQDMIKHGKVDLGFTKDMVRLALGEPDRISTRKDAGGESVVWHYITYEDPGGALLYRGWYHRSYFWHDPFYPWYTDYPERRERERFSIVLRDDKVIALEHESADGR